MYECLGKLAYQACCQEMSPKYIPDPDERRGVYTPIKDLMETIGESPPDELISDIINPPDDMHVDFDVDDLTKHDLTILVALHDLGKERHGELWLPRDIAEGITGQDISPAEVKSHLERLHGLNGDCPMGIVEPHYDDDAEEYTGEYMLAFNGHRHAENAADIIDIDEPVDESIDQLLEEHKKLLEADCVMRSC